MAEELLKELKGGLSNFTFIGEAMIDKDSFSGEIIKEGKTWCHTDSSFGVRISDKRQSFVKLYGGYKIDKPFLFAFNKDFDAIKIKWEDRFNEELWEDLNNRSFYTAKIEKDEEGKLITKRFLSAIDFAEYLSEHLTNGASIMATGDIEYGVYGADNEKLSKKYNLKAVYLNESYKRNEETVEKRPATAIARQTFLLDEYAVDKENVRELKKEGKTAIQAFVPQYISSKKVGDSFVEYKQVDPIPVPLVFTAKGEKGTDEFDKSIKIIETIWEKFFKVKKDKIREIGLYAEIAEGSDGERGKVVIDDKMRMLIDIGVLSEEDVLSQMTHNGVRRSEFVYVKPIIRAGEDGNMDIQINDDKYSPEAMVISSIDGEDGDEGGAGADLFNDSESKSEEKEDSEMSEQTFDDLFSGLD